MKAHSSDSLPLVVALGAGFGGLTFAKALDSSRARVAVIGRLGASPEAVSAPVR